MSDCDPMGCSPQAPLSDSPVKNTEVGNHSLLRIYSLVGEIIYMKKYTTSAVLKKAIEANSFQHSIPRTLGKVSLYHCFIDPEHVSVRDGVVGLSPILESTTSGMGPQTGISDSR